MKLEFVLCPILLVLPVSSHPGVTLQPSDYGAGPWTNSTISGSATTLSNSTSVMVDARIVEAPTASSSLLSNDQDPVNQSWIKSWAAVGDSFSAGIGCGESLGSDLRCARHTYAFPNLINEDERMGDNRTRKFQFFACSGATSTDVLTKQVPQVDDGIQMITVSAGGNDADFTTILNNCIYKFWTTKSCDETISDAQSYITSPTFTQNIQDLVDSLKVKLGEHGRIYYVGYAPFFNADSSICDNVTWRYWPWAEQSLLTQELRRQLNLLVSAMNAVLNDIMTASGDSVVFVDYSNWVPKVGGQFCEEDMNLPAEERMDAFFYKRGDVDPWEPSAPLEQRSDEPIYPGTFAGDINVWIHKTMEEHPDWTVEPPSANDTNTDATDAENNEEAEMRLKITVNSKSLVADVLPNNLKRVFHPTLTGHTIIANLLFYHMAAQKSMMQGYGPQPPVDILLPDQTACALPTATSGPNIPASIDCVQGGFFMTIENGEDARDDFCDYLSKQGRNIATDITKEQSMGLQYPLQATKSVGNITVWVSNAGCPVISPIVPRYEYCIDMLTAVLEQCKSTIISSPQSLADSHEVTFLLHLPSLVALRRSIVKVITWRLKA